MNGLGEHRRAWQRAEGAVWGIEASLDKVLALWLGDGGWSFVVVKV
jgi:hypothetical protein